MGVEKLSNFSSFSVQIHCGSKAARIRKNGFFRIRILLKVSDPDPTGSDRQGFIKELYQLMSFNGTCDTFSCSCSDWAGWRGVHADPAHQDALPRHLLPYAGRRGGGGGIIYFCNSVSDPSTNLRN
jgi:hypothetical protein